MNKAGRSYSLVKRLIFNLAITIGLLLGALVLVVVVGLVVLDNQRNLDNQRLTLQNASTTLLQSMLDQETGVRGYVSSLDPVFLDPVNSGRSQYSEALRELQSGTVGDEFKNSASALRVTDQQATSWYNEWAQPQIDRIRRGDVSTARNADIARDGKTRFDAFRAAVTDLRQALNNDLLRVQRNTENFQFFVITLVAIIAIISLFFIWRASSLFINSLSNQLNTLMDVTDRLEEGDLAARVTTPSSDELGRLGQNFNMMAEALQKQQAVLKEKDIQQNVLRLNASLNSSLKLELLLDQFLRELTTVLDVQIGAIYLLQPETNTLTLTAVQGIDRGLVIPQFQLDEGPLGHAAISGQPVFLQTVDPDSPQTKSFTLKTFLGNILPATLYYQPLVQGTDTLGVLITGTLTPMSESIRNVINIVSSSLTSALTNAQAFRHIQTQAEELERRKSELERNNQQLSRQRDELSVLNAALEEANRLRSQFISTMSHELRTPLTAIIGFSQLMLRGAETSNFSPRQKTNLEHILRNGQHLLDLVNDVLDIAKIEAGRMDISRSQVNIETLFRDLIDESQPLWLQKGLEVNYLIGKGVDNIETDRERLRQIILNLLSNAIKFTERGGKITLSAASRTIRPDLNHEPETAIAFSVSDTGAGIAPELQQRIFDEFYQADGGSTRKHGGTGLGLSIVSKLTDLLGGQIELKSAPSQGSTFTIILPCRTSTVPATRPGLLQAQVPLQTISAKTPAPIEEGLNAEDFTPIQGKRLVIAVDDDPSVLALIRQTLEDSQYQVVALNQPQQALELARQLHPYAITLDVMMPELNGWQILQQLKSDSATADIPIVMLTVVSDRSAGYVLGASDYLLKPVEREVLLKTLDRLAQRRVPALNYAGNGTSQPKQNGASLNGGSPGERGYILVVDDEPDVREVLEQTIADAGYFVKTAAGGREALELSQAERPGLILLDLMMPDLDGFEVLNRLKADPHTSSIPVVIQTAKNLTAQERERLHSGAVRILQKGSISLDKLVDEVNHLLKK